MQEVQQLFETHGAVLDVKLFPCLGEPALPRPLAAACGESRLLPACWRGWIPSPVASFPGRSCSLLNLPPPCSTLPGLFVLQTSSAAPVRWCAWRPWRRLTALSLR